MKLRIVRRAPNSCLICNVERTSLSGQVHIMTRGLESICREDMCRNESIIPVNKPFVLHGNKVTRSPVEYDVTGREKAV